VLLLFAIVFNFTPESNDGVNSRDLISFAVCLPSKSDVRLDDYARETSKFKKQRARSFKDAIGLNGRAITKENAAITIRINARHH